MTQDSLGGALSGLYSAVEPMVCPLPSPMPPFVLFFSFSNGRERARTLTTTASNFRDCWNAAVEKTRQAAIKARMDIHWLRIDWVENAEEVTWEELEARLRKTKRNYFRYGISLDRQFRNAFLETELNANAMLYGGPSIQHAVINEANFARYARLSKGLETFHVARDEKVFQFSTRAAFVDTAENVIHMIDGTGRNAGRRVIEQMSIADVHGLVDRGSRFLASQVDAAGRFIYGWHPCFDRRIDAYNSLRHTSTLYSMIEAWEVTRDESLKQAIDRGLSYLTEKLIKRVSQGDKELAFLLDENAEIKLGGNAVCLLALVKYSEVMATDRFLPLLEKLASGMLHMQDDETGKFNHVLNYPCLTVKEPFRIVYYDGEAAFGLMRLYALTKDERWLAAVERGFAYFISAQHWQAHDHWLAYATNELTRYRPKREYFEFGLRNFADYLGFVAERITTFPTLLELMMAAQAMIMRLSAESEHQNLLQMVDLPRFYTALETRAHYLLNGHFWPELAMFYANPARINGSFFIRHHAFRVRIDDVEHYLSGLVAYLKYRRSQVALAAE